jgi:hypothetical protein
MKREQILSRLASRERTPNIDINMKKIIQCHHMFHHRNMFLIRYLVLSVKCCQMEGISVLYHYTIQEFEQITLILQYAIKVLSNIVAL